jgi:hypothetical protein
VIRRRSRHATRRTPTASIVSAGPLILLCLLPILATCDSNPSEPSGSGGNDHNLAVIGDWELTTVIISNTCGLADSTGETEPVTLAEDGDILRITKSGRSWGIAEFDGETLHIMGTETSDELGYTAAFETEGTGVLSDTMISGTFETAVRFKPDVVEHTDCDIVSSFIMTRMERGFRPEG